MLKNLPAGKMYNFFIDDNVFFFHDLVKNSFSSIFDNFYLAGLKNIHEKYGTKFTLNSFFHNHHSTEFDLSQVDDRYRNEFEKNADWLRFAFHGYSEFPEYPYSIGCPGKMIEHYAQWHEAMCRIAGEKTLIAPVIFHYFDVTDENRRFMRQKGMNFFAVPQENVFSYNEKFDQYDISVDVILNLFGEDIDGIKNKLEAKISAGQEKILIGSHEQYAYKFYCNYIPEYFAEIETACKTMKKHGFESVYFNEL